MQFMEILLMFSRLRGLKYIEFIRFKTKNKHHYEIVAECASISILVFGVSVQFYYSSIQKLLLPTEYLVLLAFLLF